MTMGFGGRNLVLLCLLFEVMCIAVSGNVVFQVQRKYGGRGKGQQMASMQELLEHDAQRHSRMLAGVDFKLGGNMSPTKAALYFTKITIGNPPLDYHLQVDTGSDISWINCKNCQNCPTKSDLKINLRPYDLSASSTGKTVTCDQEFCDAAFNRPNPNCKVGMNCEYAITYGDGSKTEGFFVRDNFVFDQVSGNRQTSPMNSSIGFGCSAKQTGGLGMSTQAVDGIIAFGQSKTSIISQLSSSKKVKSVFSHCLDGNKGGGIFAIGEVVEPKVNRIPLVPNMPHYNVLLKGIEVSGEFLNFPSSIFDSAASKRAIIDSGSTLAYFPSAMYQQLMAKVMGKQPSVQFFDHDNHKCFMYSGNVDNAFPVVNFHFEGSAPFPVYPHDYIFRYQDNEYCIAWQSSGMETKNGREMTLLGDIALADKLIVYDIENQVLGWTQHNCLSSIKIKDEASGSVYEVGGNNLSSALRFSKANVISLLMLIVTLLYLID